MNFIKLWNFLSIPIKTQSIFVIFCMSLGVFIETIGLGLVLPIVSILTENQLSNKIFFIDYIFKYFNEFSFEKRTLYIFFSLFLFFLFKNIFLGFTLFFQSYFAFSCRRYFSDLLFKKIINNSYLNHLHSDISKIIQRIQDETGYLAANVVLPILTIFTELFIFLLVSSLIFYLTSIIVFFSLIILGLCGAIFFLSFKKKLKNWGEKRQLHDSMKVNLIQQSNGAFKDIKLSYKELIFQEKFHFHNKLATKFLTNISFSNNLPRLFFEVVAIMSILILVYFYHYLDKSPQDFIGILSLFVFSLLRLLPSAVRVLSSVQKLRISNVTVNSILEIINNDKFNSVNHRNPLIFKHKIELENVSFKFSNSKEEILSDINLTIGYGDFIGIVGSSGSGKSTLALILLGLITPTNGKYLVDGKNILPNNKPWSANIGYVDQNVFIFNDTLKNNITLFINDKDIDKVSLDNALKLSQLYDFVGSLERGLETKILAGGSNLSGGQKQRIGIARALYNKPSLLVLDEPTSSLNKEMALEVLNSINLLKNKLSIVLISHQVDTLRICDKIYCVKNRKVNKKNLNITG